MKNYEKPTLTMFAVVQSRAISSAPTLEDYLSVNGRLDTDIKDSSADSYAFGS